MKSIPYLELLHDFFRHLGLNVLGDGDLPGDRLDFVLFEVLEDVRRSLVPEGDHEHRGLLHAGQFRHGLPSFLEEPGSHQGGHGFRVLVRAVLEALLDELAERDIVVKLPLQPGKKEQRYAHLFSGEPVISDEEVLPPQEQARLRVMAENGRLSALEEEVRLLRAEMVELRKALEEFKGQFD